MTATPLLEHPPGRKSHDRRAVHHWRLQALQPRQYLLLQYWQAATGWGLFTERFLEPQAHAAEATDPAGSGNRDSLAQRSRPPPALSALFCLAPGGTTGVRAESCTTWVLALPTWAQLWPGQAGQTHPLSRVLSKVLVDRELRYFGRQSQSLSCLR